MAINIAALSVPGPLDVLDAVGAVTGWGAEATEVLAALPGRASRLLSDVEQLVRPINDDAIDVVPGLSMLRRWNSSQPPEPGPTGQ
jgi:hypothetical protein